MRVTCLLILYVEHLTKILTVAVFFYLRSKDKLYVLRYLHILRCKGKSHGNLNLEDKSRFSYHTLFSVSRAEIFV